MWVRAPPTPLKNTRVWPNGFRQQSPKLYGIKNSNGSSSLSTRAAGTFVPFLGIYIKRYIPRKQKKYHYIYKTTNIINQKYYIGMHSTSNLEDGYIGSGKRLWYSINKYGKENFKCEILEFFPDKISLKEKEIELVNEDTLKNKMCMNLVYGGGGWPNNGTAIGGDKFKGAQKYWEIPENKEQQRKQMSERSKKLWEDENYRRKIINLKPMLGKKHKEETIEKMKGHTSQVDEKNSQYGKPRSEETKQKIRNSHNRRLGKTNN